MDDPLKKYCIHQLINTDKTYLTTLMNQDIFLINRCYVYTSRGEFVEKLYRVELNCFCGMVDRRKMFSLISSRDHYQRSSPSRMSDTPRAGFEPAQNLSSGSVEWSCAALQHFADNLSLVPGLASTLPCNYLWVCFIFHIH